MTRRLIGASLATAALLAPLAAAPGSAHAAPRPHRLQRVPRHLPLATVPTARTSEASAPAPVTGT
jgi:hypothetical protein